MSLRKSPRTRYRRPRFESLEDRRMLSVSPEWLIALGKPEQQSGFFNHIAVGADGTVTTTARFNGTVDFDPGDDPAELTNPAPLFEAGDVAVVRYNADGQWMWHQQIGSADRNQEHQDIGLAVDRAGNTYVLGMFSGAVQIGSHSFTGDYMDGYIAKFRPDGTVAWAKAIKTSDSRYNEGRGLAIDDSHSDENQWSIYVSGWFNGSLTIQGQSGTQTYRSSSGYDGFLSKLSAETGNAQWTQTISGKGDQQPFALALGHAGDSGLYMAGKYTTELKIGGITLKGGSQFVAKLNPQTGAWQWAKNVVALNFQDSLTTSPNGVVFGGSYSGTIDADPGSGVYSLTSVGGTSDVALVKLSTSGDFVWARSAGGASIDTLQSITKDPSGRVLASGRFRGTAQFGNQALDSAQLTIPSTDPNLPPRSGGFVTVLDSGGEFLESHTVPLSGNAVAGGPNGEIYVNGGGYWVTEDGITRSLPSYYPTGDTIFFHGGRDLTLLKYSLAPQPIDPIPRIDTFYAAVDHITAGEKTLTITRVHDPNRQFHAVNFYRDNGDGVLVVGVDPLVGTDNDIVGGWTRPAAITGLPPGAYTYFAQAVDSEGNALAEADVEINVVGVEVMDPIQSTNVPKAIGGKSGLTTSTLVVPESDSFDILDLNVTLNITHTYDSDLVVSLIGPDGTRILLFTRVGGSGDNFQNTTLDDEAAISIVNGTAPFFGSFKPQSYLSDFDGKDAGGIWTLEIRDVAGADKGTLNSWSLTFTRELASGFAAALEPQSVSLDLSAPKSARTGFTPAVRLLSHQAPLRNHTRQRTVFFSLCKEPLRRLPKRRLTLLAASTLLSGQS